LILNISRAKELKRCPAAALYRYHYGLSGERSMNLVDGSAFHKGVAVGQATKNWAGAVIEAKQLFNNDLTAAGMMPEEDFLVAAHWKVVNHMIKLYQENWDNSIMAGATVVQPECTFEIDIPNTEHNDITLHWYNNENGTHEWGMPPADAITRGIVRSPHAPTTWGKYTFSDLVLSADSRTCACYRPHRLVGRTDGILSWNGYLWLQEHKSSSIKDDRFWQQWHTDIQLTGYIYGVGKSLGIFPKGVILNMVYKPSESQIANWNNKRKNGPSKDVTEYMEYQREIFTRTDQQVADFERMFTSIASEWERRILENDFTPSPLPGHCYNYNRRCDFIDITLGNWSLEDAVRDMVQRDPDYVDEDRAEQLVQIQGALAC
jgi:hypothetical protein